MVACDDDGTLLLNSHIYIYTYIKYRAGFYMNAGLFEYLT